MKITNPEALMAASISRRSPVKTSAIGSLALASSAFTLPFSRIAHAAADLASGNMAEKAVWSSCTVNCGSRCLLRLHVKMTPYIGLNQIPRATMNMATIRYAPACAVVLFVAG